MDRPPNNLASSMDEEVMMDDDSHVQGIGEGAGTGGMGSALISISTLGRSPLTKNRSLSDGGGTPSKLSPSPHIVGTAGRTSKDDFSIKDLSSPVTPQRPSGGHGHSRGLSLQVPLRDREFTPPPAASNPYIKPAPLSPKLDHSQIYASPTNILPRRSRGLDFSRAATSLHHSTLAEQSSPDSSPTIGGGRAMNIPMRRNIYGGPEQTSTSLWSMMGSHEKMNISGSLGSTNAIASDMSSSSSDDDLMDEEMEDSYVTTPQISKMAGLSSQSAPGAAFGSPAMSSLMSFQQRQRPRKNLSKKRKPLGLGFSNVPSSIINPPNTSGPASRRESISWQANQLHISGADSEESSKGTPEGDASSGDGQRAVVRRVVNRRANLLPKTKTFARIRAALAEEGAPVESDVRHEAEVVKQVRESDRAVEARPLPIAGRPPSSAGDLSSPDLRHHDVDEAAMDDTIGDLATGLSGSFKQQAMKNSKGKQFWETFSDSGSVSGSRTTPPPPAFCPRGSSSGLSEDVGMDSPSISTQSGFPTWTQSQGRADSSRSDTPQASQGTGPAPPTAADITRRINSKRRRDDDFDPIGFSKRRAVSPGMSIHNSPVLQSPMQRDVAPWGTKSTGGASDKPGSGAPSDSGSIAGTPGNHSNGASGNSAGSSGPGSRAGGKGRVGFQGMVDTNDGIMRMSIE